MKGINIDISCVSPSSTAICSTTHTTKSLNSYLAHHYKTLTTTSNSYHHYNNTTSTRSAPCIFELPFTPKPKPKPKPSSFSTYRDKTRNLPSHLHHHTPMRKRSADATDIKHYRTLNYTRFHSQNENEKEDENTRRDYVKAKKNDTARPLFASEGRRSRSGSMSMLEDDEKEKEKEKMRKHFSLIHVTNERKAARANKYNVQLEKDPSFPTSSQSDQVQVVVLRVSLHCRGCENRLRRHLSKMDGVASYNIDMATKKVTVVGNVTPSEVLSNISKVKNAQLWPSQPSSSSTSSPSSSTTTTTTAYSK